MALPALDLTEPDHKFKLRPFVCGIDSHWLAAKHPDQTIEKDPTLEDLRLILIYLPSRKIWRPLWSVSTVERKGAMFKRKRGRIKCHPRFYKQAQTHFYRNRVRRFVLWWSLGGSNP